MISRGKLATAERELGQALRESRQAYGEDGIPTLRVREGIAQVRKDQGRIEEAGQILQDIVDSLERQGLVGEPIYFLALNNLGDILLKQEKYADADALFLRAQALMPTQRDRISPTDPAVLLVNRGHAAHGLGDAEKAEEFYRQAIGELGTLHPGGSPELATAMSNLALLLDERGSSEEAFALLKRAVLMDELAFPQGHPTVITSWVDLAQRAMALGDGAFALEAARKAADVAARILDASEPLAIYTNVILAEALLYNDDPVAADPVLRAAQREVAKMPPESKNLRNLISDLGSRLCQSPAAANLQGCAGR
jgi:tetratricopeptide (TPR) repeat protein